MIIYSLFIIGYISIVCSRLSFEMRLLLYYLCWCDDEQNIQSI